MPYRKAIPQSAELGDICEDDVLINDRDIAIIDDTFTTGKTLSDISELILGTYVPRSIKPLLCKTILAYIKCLAFSNTISYI